MEERDDAVNMLHLTRLPNEIIHNILQWLNPDDLANLPRTCRFLNNYVKGNQRLCRDIYVHHLDTPEDDDLDWEQELHDFVRLDRVCAQADVDKKKGELAFVYNTVTRLLKNASSSGERISHSATHAASRNAAVLAQFFRHESNREAFLCRSFLFERARGEVRPLRFNKPPKDDHQQSAKLHCLFGRPILNCGRTRSSRMYPFACSKVYDMRQYTPRTRWGPFMDDSSDRVDWEKVEAVLIVLGSNIRNQHLTTRAFTNTWDTPFVGSWSGSYLPSPHQELSTIDERDPYGIAGTWLRVVCFVDYNDFFRHNFPITDTLPDNVPRPALNVVEATRLIIMKVHVTAVEPPGDNDGQDLPVVHFEGVSRSLDDSWDENANSDLRGICRLTREGEVRWTTFSIFNGVDRWRSEGVQIGGVRSARGVIGNWFDNDYDPHGPVGPTAFWKISDPRRPRGDDTEVGLTDFLPIVDSFDMDSDEEEDPDFTIGEYGLDDDEDDEVEEDEEAAVAQDLLALAQPDIIDITFLAAVEMDDEHAP